MQKFIVSMTNVTADMKTDESLSQDLFRVCNFRYWFYYKKNSNEFIVNTDNLESSLHDGRKVFRMSTY